MTQKHTQLPYHVREDQLTADVWPIGTGPRCPANSRFYSIEIPAYAGGGVALVRKKEDAAFIVRACNSHYELLEAAKAADTLFFSWVNKNLKHDDPGKELILENWQKVKDAIAKAEAA